MSLPRYINSRSIAAWLGPTWRPQRIQRILRNLGVAKTIGKAVVVKPEDLAAVWPDVYELMLEKLDEIPEVDHGHVGKKRAKPANKQTVVRNTYDYDSNPCTYEVGGGWSCAPECENPNHKK